MSIEDRIRTIIGVVTMITAADIGVVKLKPLKKVSIFSATPKKAAAMIRGKSANKTFSFGPRKETAQKSKAAPLTRSKINPYGKMYCGMTSLAMVNVSP
jgi:hypothetical protein